MIFPESLSEAMPEATLLDPVFETFIIIFLSLRTI